MNFCKMMSPRVLQPYASIRLANTCRRYLWHNMLCSAMPYALRLTNCQGLPLTVKESTIQSMGKK